LEVVGVDLHAEIHVRRVPPESAGCDEERQDSPVAETVEVSLGAGWCVELECHGGLDRFLDRKAVFGAQDYVADARRVVAEAHRVVDGRLALDPSGPVGLGEELRVHEGNENIDVPALAEPVGRGGGELVELEAEVTEM